MDRSSDILKIFKSGDWIDTLTQEENRLLVDFLRQSMAKTSKKIAFAERIEGGVLYAVYKVRHRKEENILDLIVPGEIYLHREEDDVPQEIVNIPRTSLDTIFKLAKIENE